MIIEFNALRIVENGRYRAVSTRNYLFLRKEGVCVNEIVRRLFNVFGEGAMPQSTVYNRINYFRTRRQSLDDGRRRGRPLIISTAENISIVEKCLLKNGCITVPFVSFTNATYLCH